MTLDSLLHAEPPELPPPSRPGGGPRIKRRGIARPLVYSVIFIVATAAATAILALSIANTSVGTTTGYSAVFTDVTGLNVGDDVDIAGVRIGQVTSIAVVDRNLAEVGFAIQADHGHRHRVALPERLDVAEPAHDVHLAAVTGIPVGAWP